MRCYPHLWWYFHHHHHHVCQKFLPTLQRALQHSNLWIANVVERAIWNMPEMFSINPIHWKNWRDWDPSKPPFIVHFFQKKKLSHKRRSYLVCNVLKTDQRVLNTDQTVRFLVKRWRYHYTVPSNMPFGYQIFGLFMHF